MRFFKQLFTAVFLVFLQFFINPAAMASPLRFEVRAHPISNLIYQLDCMAQVFKCSTKAYEELWRKSLKWDLADQDRLKQWKNIRLKYQGEIKLDEPPAQPFALPWSGPNGIQLGDKFSIVTYHATHRNDLRQRLETLVAPTDMETIDSLLVHFEPRFLSWWKNSAQTSLLAFKKDLDKKVNQLEVLKKVQGFANFYEAKYPPNYLIYLNLFYRPASDEKATYATVYENHAVIEVLSGENVANVLDIVIHEICHFFYSSSSHEKKSQFLEAFANSSDPLAIATHNILNEALATALGNGIAAELWMDSKRYKERLGKERGFYNDTAIDTAAKLLIPMLKTDLHQGKTLYAADFPEKSISALRTGMPDLIRAPARLLTELVIIYDLKFKEVLHEKIRRKLRGGSYSREGFENESSWEMLKTYPKLNSMLLLSPDSLKLLTNRTQWIPRKDLDAIKALFKKKGSFVYAIERSPSSYTFVVAGNSSDEIEKEFLVLLEAKDRFIGPLLSLGK